MARTLSLSPKKLWRTIKNLSGLKIDKNLTAIELGDRQQIESRKCTKEFCKQFVEHPTVHDRGQRAILRTLRNLNRGRQKLSFEQPAVSNAFNNAKPSRAIGTDGWYTLMLKKLGEGAMRFLTRLVKLSIHTLVVPDIWKVARIIPILNPNKPATRGESYRLISLLSPVVKILEALLLPTFKRHFPLAEHQHGRRTTTALTEITSSIANGFNQQRQCQRIVVAALDLSKAFDTVDHTVLLGDILNSTLPNDLKR